MMQRFFLRTMAELVVGQRMALNVVRGDAG
jgi:hypothetical protein